MTNQSIPRPFQLREYRLDDIPAFTTEETPVEIAPFPAYASDMDLSLIHISEPTRPY